MAEKYPALLLPPFDEISEIVGVEGIFAISEHLGGAMTYIPSAKKIIMPCIQADARKNYKGNYKSLSERYGLSVSTIRRMVDGNACNS